MFRLLRPLGIAVIVLVVVTGSRAHPRPGVHGEHLGILLALIGFGVGVAGVIAYRRETVHALVPFFAALVVSSSVLVALQPKGPAFLGAFIAVVAAGFFIGTLRGCDLPWSEEAPSQDAPR